MKPTHAMMRMTAIRKRIVIASLIFTLGIVGLTAWRVAENRRLAIQGTEMIAAGARDAALASVGQVLRSLDLSLRGIQRGVWLLEGQTLDEATQRALLFDNSVESEAYGALYVVDRDGMPIFDLRGSDAQPPIQRVDTESFRIHVEHPEQGLYIGRPDTLPPAADLPLTRRLTTRSGKFFGVAAGHVSMAYLRSILTNRQIPGLNLSILFEDGSHLIRVSDRPDAAHAPTSVRTLAKLAEKSRDTYVDAGGSDGKLRVVSFARIDGFPLILRASVEADLALATWQSRAIFFSSVLAALIVIQLGLSYQLWQQLTLREEARQEEATLAMEMAELAHTDQLTCLANRRGFEGALDKECRRATRDERPVSLLLIDIDHFKSVNDTLGHQSGDAALIDIADCLRACLRRAGDHAARFGGDEFAIILPNVDGDGARAVAEAIRAAVLAKELRFAGARLITLSIGIATSAGPAPAPTRMIEAADRALYRAKESGRNRVAWEPARAFDAA